MERNVIIHKILELIGHVTLGRKIGTISMVDSPLTGSEVGLASTELVYLLLEVSDLFHIKFNADDVNNYSFFTVSAIADIVQKKIS